MTVCTNSLLIACCLAALPIPTWATIDFDREIRPILSEYCFHCHGFDAKTREANLRLDTPDGAFSERDGWSPIVPGKPEKSEILHRMLESDPDERMPPAKAKIQMMPEEIKKVRQWIKEGANWTEHWAFESIKKPKRPTGDAHPIDAFLQRRLKEEGLALSPETSRPRLIRRVTLDLTGVPPTPAEVQAFVADSSAEAYDQVVDRLLASPRYGERMAWPWLDAARYSDTDGFQGDPTRDMWPWRDWLVNALNDNLPFDQFTIEMLAGDMLPDATPAQRLASGFNRNHTYNGEGGRIPEETRVENVFDRVETTSTVWMGLTMTCARCHDHKYDPISQKEYFQLYAFFNNTSESGKGGRGKAPPIMDFTPPSTDVRLAELAKRTKAIDEKLAAPDKALDAEQIAWEKRLANKSQDAWVILSPEKLTSKHGATMARHADETFTARGINPQNDTYEFYASTELKRLESIRLEALRDETTAVKGPGRDHQGNFVMTDFKFSVRPIGTDEYKKAIIASAEADHEQKGFKISHVFDDDPNSGWAVDGHHQRVDRKAVFRLKEPLESKHGFEVKIEMAFNSKWATHNLARGRLSISNVARNLEDDPDAQNPIINKTLAIPAHARTEQQAHDLRVEFRRNHAKNKKYWADQYAKLNEERAALNKGRPRVMIMDELPADRQRTTFILDRGAYDKPTKIEVQKGTPECLPPLPATEPLNRLTLARWLVNPNHPLTARVTVNRYWQLFFGRGQVSTTEDFGSQGAKPEHPELFDWLAATFVESGWDVKAMHRLIVTSQAYKQSARISPVHLEKDPDNKWLARASRHRMPSWMLRDQALALSGLMNPQMGGPGVKPYQPAGIWAEATFGKIKYTPDSGDKLYRRSLYTFWRRIVGPTMFFDSAKRQTCEVKVPRTNTPLHALTTLNETLFVEAARAMAQRVLAKPDAARIPFAFQLVTARQPDDIETAYLEERIEALRQAFGDDPTSAETLLKVGSSPRDEQFDPVEHAAWTALCSILLNLDEVLCKP